MDAPTMRPSTEPTAIARTASWMVSSGALGSSGKGFPSFTRDMSPAASSWGALCSCALARACHRSTKASRRVVDWELLLILLLWIYTEQSTSRPPYRRQPKRDRLCRLPGAGAGARCCTRPGRGNHKRRRAVDGWQDACDGRFGQLLKIKK